MSKLSGELYPPQAVPSPASPGQAADNLLLGVSFLGFIAIWQQEDSLSLSLPPPPSYKYTWGECSEGSGRGGGVGENQQPHKHTHTQSRTHELDVCGEGSQKPNNNRQVYKRHKGSPILQT